MRCFKYRPFITVFTLVLQNAFLMFCARLALLFFLYREITQTEDILHGLYIGLKFDVRIAVFLSLPTAFALCIPALSRKISCRGKPLNILSTITGIMAGFVFIIYIFDFGVFFYLRQRFDLGLSVFLEDPLESYKFIWENYPVVLITIGILLLFYIYIFTFRKIVLFVGQRIDTRKRHIAVSFGTMLFLFIAGYGQISSNFFPLRWSNAYFSTDRNIALLAINPVQNIYDTRNFGKAIPPNEVATIAAWQNISQYLHLPESNQPLNYVRHYKGEKRNPPLNFVLIIMESLCWERTSLAPVMPKEMGEDINPTPFLKELSEKSLYYPNFYAPTRTTARAVFTTMTGIPDVNHSGGTTSRNPKLVDHTCVFNEFHDYEKYYMIGGNANWANIRGILQYNVDNLHLLEESFWKAPNVDVWGISDIALFREANDVLTQSSSPFIAVIQTASFHRPYTIPDDNESFKIPREASHEALDWYGFESNKEYYSLKLSDHALRRFFEKASRQPWYNNTVFVIMGDHGLNNFSNNIGPVTLACNLQAWHIPLLIYAPGGQVAPSVNTAFHIQPDIFPTMASLAGLDFYNTTLGRNLLDPQNDINSVAFISQNDKTRFLLKNGFVYAMTPFGNGLYSLSQEEGRPFDLTDNEPELAESMHKEVMDFYYTSQYMLSHNGRKQIVPEQENKDNGGAR